MLNWLVAFLFIIFPFSAGALDVPQLKGRVNDYASILSPETAQKLDAALSAIESSDSTQIVVLTIPSLEGEVLEEFSIKVAEAWKIGQNNLDNGAILLVSKNDRKLRIEVGRGLEGKLTDLISGRIISSEIIPRFREGDFNGGIEAGINAIVSVVRGEYKASETNTATKRKRQKPHLYPAYFSFCYNSGFVRHFENTRRHIRSCSSSCNIVLFFSGNLHDAARYSCSSRLCFRAFIRRNNRRQREDRIPAD